ncbi:MAG: hypothetical protein J6R18_05660 [Kiritimatiellae bacterium]|nr:hypothetical protein [Kiritimatiellia bacterium]
MKIEKNAEGSYVLTCCDFEVIALESALSTYAKQTEDQNNRLYKKGTDEWLPMAEYATKLWRLAGQIYAKLPDDCTEEKVNRCKHCLAVFGEGESLCKK